MNKIVKTDISHKSPDIIFVLILLSIFAFASFGAIVFGANIYASVAEQMDANFNKVTPLSYVASKVREHDESGGVAVMQKESVNALVLSQKEDGKIYETWIYSYENHLYDLLIEQGTKFNLKDGMRLIPNYGLDITMADKKLLKLRSYDQNGKTLSLNISLRSFAENPEDDNAS